MQTIEIEKYTLEDHAVDNKDFKKEVFDDPEYFLQAKTLVFNDNVPYSARDELLDIARFSDPNTPLANVGNMLYKQRAYVWRIVNSNKQKIIIYQKED